MMRETPENFVNDTSPQSTLRELRDHLAQPLALMLMGGLAMILTLILPQRADSAPLRFVFWMLVVVLTYAVGCLAYGFADRRYASRAMRIAVGAALTGTGATLVVLGLGWIILSDLPAGRDLVWAMSNIAAIAVIISVMLHLLYDQPTPPAPQRCLLLDRLPLDKRGALVALSVEDHYVRVRTTKGEDVLLMRLSDAIRETGGLRGLQVHRSHWVALDHVTAARRKGDGAVLTLRTGPDIPVSRANLPAIKEAGLLPR